MQYHDQRNNRSGLSVAVCTYNGEAYLGEQLLSIAGQTRPPDEMVVCDDNSSDTTVKVLEESQREALRETCL